MISISSYNCRGLPTMKTSLYKKPEIIDLIENNDIVCFQETWYAKQDLKNLNSLHDKMYGIGSATIGYEDKILQGRPDGGTAILWKRNLNTFITPIELQYNWITGIYLKINTRKIAILSVYMPCLCNLHDDKYLESLAILSTIIEELDCGGYYIIGDWNADLNNSINHKFGGYLASFLKDTSLLPSSTYYLPVGTYTFSSEAWKSKSWIDHCISSEDAHAAIKEMQRHYDMTNSDHIPFSLKIECNIIPEVIEISEYQEVTNSKHMTKLSPAQIDTYRQMTSYYLSRIKIPIDAISCSDCNCTNENHILSISKYYGDIVDTLITCGKSIKPNKKHFRKKNISGWTEYIKEKYLYTKECYRVWRDAGKPRNGELNLNMMRSRASLKYAIRANKRNEEKTRHDKLANSLMSNKGNFWHEIKNIDCNQTTIPKDIDSHSGIDNVVEFWNNHYKTVFNCLKGNNREFGFHVQYDDNMRIKNDEVENCIKSINSNKAPGFDGLYSEHLKYSDRSLACLLSDCFSSFLIHSILPESLMLVVINPCIKDKSGRNNDSNNYRPISIASCISKVFEEIILNRITNKLLTSSNQFGYKKKVGTDMCLYSIKEILLQHQQRNGNIFMCFLDASKAFDRVNYNILFKKLENRGIDPYIIRIISYWYKNQRMKVRWGGRLSTGFNVSNGVRQGGILSSYLFNVYMDDLSIKLNNRRIGCFVGNILVNHLLYADDILLISPSAAGLRKLLGDCEDYGYCHDIIFNPKKSAIMICRNSNAKFASYEFQMLNEKIKEKQEVKYLGHILTNTLTDDKDMLRQCRYLYAQGNILARKFYMCSESVKVKLFKTYCSSLYTSQLWSKHKQMMVQKVEVAYNNAFRILLNLPRHCSASLMLTTRNTDSCSTIIRKLIYRFKIRIDTSTNVILKSIIKSDIRWNSTIQKHWNKLLFTRNSLMNYPTIINHFT